MAIDPNIKIEEELTAIRKLLEQILGKLTEPPRPTGGSWSPYYDTGRPNAGGGRSS
jgi:hypothetical protein